MHTASLGPDGQYDDDDDSVDGDNNDDDEDDEGVGDNDDDEDEGNDDDGHLTGLDKGRGFHLQDLQTQAHWKAMVIEDDDGDDGDYDDDLMTR